MSRAIKRNALACMLAVLALLAGAAAAAGLETAIAQATALPVERVCAPYSDIRGGDTLWCPKPDGSGWTLLIRYYKHYNEHIHFAMIDPASGQINHRHFDKRFYAISLVGPDGKGYGHTSEGVMVYDPARNALDMLPGSPVVGGETKPMVIGPDGKIYGTGSRNHTAVAYQIDPATGTFTDYGEIGPSHAPNTCWGYSVAADERFVYVVSGKLPWYLVAYDRETGEDSVLLTHDDPSGIIMLGTGKDEIVASIRHSSGKPEEFFWVAHGKAVPREAGSAPPDNRVAPPPGPAAPPQPELRGGVKPDAEGRVAFEIRPAGAADWLPVRYEVPVYSANIYQVQALPDGRVAGVGGNYLGPFVHDPRTGACESLGGMGVSVPVMVVHEGLVYMSGYPRGVTFAWDPSRGWGDGNPRKLGSLGNEGSGIHTTFAIVKAADGRIYYGGGWHRNGEGGGLGWWDPKTQSAGGTYEGMGNYRVTHMTTTGNGRYVVLSTKAVFDQEKQIPAPPQGRIFVYDTTARTMKATFDPIAGAPHSGAIADGGGTRVVALTVAPEPADLPWHERGSILYAFDAVSGRIEWKRDLPYPIGFVVNENYDNTVPFDFVAGPDGRIWSFTGGEMRVVNPDKAWGLTYEDARLVRIDPADGAIEVVGRVGPAGRMAFSGGDLYLSGGSKYHTSGADSLRRIRNIVR